MGTPGKRLGGKILGGDLSAALLPFVTHQSRTGVVAVAEFLIEESVAVKTPAAKLERLTYCGNRGAVFSAVGMSASVRTAPSPGDTPARLIWELFGLPPVPDRGKKRRKRERALVLAKITVPITNEARASSDREHIGRCRGDPNSTFCNVAKLVVTFTLHLPSDGDPLEVTLAGNVAMAFSQPYNAFFYPPSYHRAMAVFYPTVCAQWSPRLAFSLVTVKHLIELWSRPGVAAHFAARAIVRAAVLVYANVDGDRVLLIPDDVGRVVNIPSTSVGAADIFAIHKLFTTLPARFYVDQHDNLQHAPHNTAMVYDEDTKTCSSHWIRAIRPKMPLVGLKPADDVPPWKWPADTWFCTKAIARTFGKVYPLMHRS